ncbi:MAG TPA: hypothetical protein DCZ12_12160 [Gammaproteobacteria bacterium]|nr:hypothetical protein [Gammaproteobacteria bacterium]
MSDDTKKLFDKVFGEMAAEHMKKKRESELSEPTGDFTELLPCPFCGGEAHYTAYKSEYGGEKHNVECAACGAEAGWGDSTGGLSWTTEIAAKNAWNRRAR